MVDIYMLCNMSLSEKDVFMADSLDKKEKLGSDIYRISTDKLTTILP